MRVGVDDAGYAVAQVQHLQPHEHRARLLAWIVPQPGRRVGTWSWGEKHLVRRVHLDHVHESEHPLEASVRGALGVAIPQHLHEVRVVHLHDLVAAAVPEGEPLDLCQRVVVAHGRSAAVLRVPSLDEGKRILVIDRQE